MAAGAVGGAVCAQQDPLHLHGHPLLASLGDHTKRQHTLTLTQSTSLPTTSPPHPLPHSLSSHCLPSSLCSLTSAPCTSPGASSHCRRRAWRTNLLLILQAVLFTGLIWAVDRAGENKALLRS